MTDGFEKGLDFRGARGDSPSGARQLDLPIATPEPRSPTRLAPHPDGSGFLRDLECLLNQVMGETNGSHALRALCARYHGSEVYIPTLTERFRDWRNRQIANGFKGDYRPLAVEWKLSIQQVRRIVRREGERSFPDEF